jgi:hypothetical protein
MAASLKPISSTTAMKTLFLTTVAFAALIMIAPIGTAHADVDAWTKEHGRQFEARWRNNPKAGSPQWHAEMRQFCKEGEMHQYDIGVWSAKDAIEAMDRCNSW